MDLNDADVQSLGDAASDGGFDKEYQDSTLTWPFKAAPELPDKYVDFGGRLNGGLRYLAKRRHTNE